MFFPVVPFVNALGVGTAITADEGHLPAESGETRIQLPGPQEKRRGEYHYKVTTEKKNYKVSQVVNMDSNNRC